MFRSLVFLGWMMVSAATALAQSVPPLQKPDIKVGDKWVFRTVDLWKNEEQSRVETKVSDVDGDRIYLYQTTLSSRTGRDVGIASMKTADRSTWTISDPSVTTGAPIALAFPLEVGQTWEYKYSFRWRNSGTNTRTMTAKVESWEDVEVPAGKFKALKVVHSGHYDWRRDDNKSWSGSVSEILWYVPEVRRFVKREYRDTDGYGRTEDQTLQELTAYDVK